MTDVCQYKPSWKGVLMKNTFLFISVVICALVLVACSSRKIERFSAILEGSQVIPPVDTNASGEVSVASKTRVGSGGFLRPPKCISCTITFNGNVNNLSSEITVAHVHLDNLRKVLFTLEVNTSGDISKLSAKLSGDFAPSLTVLNYLRESNLYIDVHTKEHPHTRRNHSGEVRGQILRR